MGMGRKSHTWTRAWGLMRYGGSTPWCWREASSGNIYGVIRKDLEPGYTMASPALRMDGALDGGLGASLAEGLEGSDDGLGGAGDELYILEQDGSWRALYLDGQKTWREAAGTPSTYQLNPGQGFFVSRRASSSARVTFAGPVGNDGTRSCQIVTGWNLIGLSEGRELSIQQAFTGVAQGAASEDQADQLILQNPDGSWRRLMYVDGWGAPYDGNWFDLSTFQIVSTNEVLQPGAAYYYLRRGAATDLGF